MNLGKIVADGTGRVDGWTSKVLQEVLADLKIFTKSIGHRYKSKLGDRVGEAARICNATLPLRGLASGGREAEARICGLYCVF